jgi:hypothetical protein
MQVGARNAPREAEGSDNKRCQNEQLEQQISMDIEQSMV